MPENGDRVHEEVTKQIPNVRFITDKWIANHYYI